MTCCTHAYKRIDMGCMDNINSHCGSVRADVPSAPGVGRRLAKALPFKSAAVLANFWIRCAQCRRIGSLASRRRTRLEPMPSLSLVFKFRRSFDADFHGRRLPQRRHRNHGFGILAASCRGLRSRSCRGRGHCTIACRTPFPRAPGSRRRNPDGDEPAASDCSLLHRRWTLGRVCDPQSNSPGNHRDSRWFSHGFAHRHARLQPSALRRTPHLACAARSPAGACLDALTVRHAHA